MTEADLGELRSTVEKLLAAPGEATSCWARLASAGVATVLIEAGESGMRVLAGVGEQIGHALSDVPFMTIAGGVAAAVRTAPQSSTRSELLAGLDEGVTAALAVPGSFSVVSARLPLPVLESGSLSGAVYDVLADPLTRLFIVPCTDGDEPCLAVVDAEDVQVSEAANLDPTRHLVTIRFDKSRAHLLQRGGDVRRAVADAVRIETVALSAEMIGAAEAALEETVTFVSGRVAFGGLIAEQQAVRHRCVDRFVEIATAKALMTEVLDAAGEDLVAVALLKIAAGRALANAAEDFTLLRGAMGFTWESGGHRYRRRALVDCSIRGDEAELARFLDDQLTKPIPPPRLSADEFTRAATTWLDATAPGFGAEPDDRGYFGVLDEQELADRLVRARAWERCKHKAGWAGLAVPTVYGGQSRSSYEAGVFALLEGGHRLPHVQFEITRAVVLPALLAWGSEPQKAFYLPRILDGTDLWCQLSSEPDAGSDLGMLATRAVRTDSGWRISGQKIWTSGAQWADFGLLLARTDPELPKHRGISAFVVPMDAPGIDIRPIRQATGYAGFCEVFFDEVDLAADGIVGAPGSGWQIAMTTLGNERQALSGSGIPFDRIFGLARELGGSATARSHLRELLLAMHTLAALSRASLNRLRDASAPGPEASISKLLTGRAASEGAAAVAAILGTALASRPEWSDYVLGSVGLRIGGGTEEVQKNVIADRIIRLPREPRKDADVPWSRLLRTTSHPITSRKASS